MFALGQEPIIQILRCNINIYITLALEVEINKKSLQRIPTPLQYPNLLIEVSEKF